MDHGIDIHQSRGSSRSRIAALTHFLLLCWAVICVLPLYWVVLASFKDAGAIDGRPTYLPFVDFKPSLEAWHFIFLDAKDNLLPRALNSLLAGVFSTFAVLFLSGMAAYGITRFERNSGNVSVLLVLLCSRVLPPVVIALPLYVMAQFSGWLDHLSLLVFIYTAINLPVAIWMLTIIFGPRPTDQEEAARLEGASHFHILFFVLMPMVRAVVVWVGLLVFVQCWNEYLFAAYLTSNHALTIPPWMVGQVSIKEAQTGGGAEDVAHLAAATVFMTLPVIVLTMLAQSSFVRDLRLRPARGFR